MSHPVKFIRQDGIGETSNYYIVTIDGEEVGKLFCDYDGQWNFHRRTPTYMKGIRLEYENRPSVKAATFADAEQAVRELFIAAA